MPSTCKIYRRFLLHSRRRRNTFQNFLPGWDELTYIDTYISSVSLLKLEESGKSRRNCPSKVDDIPCRSGIFSLALSGSNCFKACQDPHATIEGKIHLMREVLSCQEQKWCTVWYWSFFFEFSSNVMSPIPSWNSIKGRQFDWSHRNP